MPPCHNCGHDLADIGDRRDCPRCGFATLRPPAEFVVALDGDEIAERVCAMCLVAAVRTANQDFPGEPPVVALLNEGSGFRCEWETA